MASAIKGAMESTSILEALVGFATGKVLVTITFVKADLWIRS
jgi:hypothetical protein